MLTYWMDLNDPFRAFDGLRRRMNQVFREYEPRGDGRTGGLPRASLRDTKEAFVLTAEVPGLRESELELSVTGDSLAIRGERKLPAPEGYSAHRQERGALKFARSFAVPARIDPEKVTATIKNGLLTVTMPKHPESKPKAITVKAH